MEGTVFQLWMPTSLVFVVSKGKRIQELTKIVKMEEVKKNSSLLRDLMNFNEISGKTQLMMILTVTKHKTQNSLQTVYF